MSLMDGVGFESGTVLSGAHVDGNIIDAKQPSCLHRHAMATLCGVRAMDVSSAGNQGLCQIRFARPTIVLLRRETLAFSPPGHGRIVARGGVIIGGAGQQVFLMDGEDRWQRRTLIEYAEGTIRQALVVADGAGAPLRQLTPVRVLPPSIQLDALHRLLWVTARRSDRDPNIREIALLMATVCFRSPSARPLVASSEPVHNPGGVERVRLAMHHIESRHRAGVSLGEAAAVSGLSRYHFHRLFARELGLTPRDYLVHVRLRRAMCLLFETALSERQVASTVGFVSLPHFRRVFRERVGCYPRAFRASSIEELSRQIAASIVAGDAPSASAALSIPWGACGSRTELPTNSAEE